MADSVADPPPPELSGRQVERDFALANLRRVTLGAAVAAATVTGFIAFALADGADKNQLASAASASAPPRTPPVVVIVVPVAGDPPPQYVYDQGSSTGSGTSYPVENGSTPRVAPPTNPSNPQQPGRPAPSPSSTPAPIPAPTARPTPPPQPTPPVCTSSPSLCPKP